MQLQVRGKNLPVTDALEAHVEKKLEKLDRLIAPWNTATQVEVELFVDPHKDNPFRQIAEATVRTKGSVLRARDGADDMYIAIDHVVAKLERQAARYRERRRDHRERPKGAPAPVEETHSANGAGAFIESQIVKRKKFEMKPMALDDAMLQFELISHDFFVFRDRGTGLVSVLYRRDDGQFGLIAPEE
jgi:putative sigma-54 modulation protein